MKRWKLSFPQVTHHMTGRAVLVLSCTPFSTTHGEATAWDGSGRVVHLVVELAALERAPLVTLAQVDDQRAAPALIFDHQGRVLVSKEGRS